jgi:L-malate glycosyltransferase
MEKESPGKFRFTVAGAERGTNGFSFVNFTGEINEEQKLRDLYAAHDILLLTSSREGFPMVIMEAMAAGLAVIATPVGDIPNRVNGENGVVISSAEEDHVIPQMVSELRRITSSEELLLAIKQEAKNYARENFSEEKFREAYRNLLGLDQAQ